ncbi:thermonuclease family protein, partial [Patescibacteria group bacterium]|nr:thermonuclease family protein [Patescibacteria group bacterium]
MLLNFKKTLFLLVAIIVLVIFSSQVFSYDTNIAHPYLTQKAIELFNNNNNNQKISNQEMQWIIQGAKEEDTPIRWMNHYYNPITNKGLWNFSSAKDWSKQNIRQMLYSKGNQTWQKALQEYRNNNKKQAFIALGHILHLIEDMAVPAHTRLDPHVLGDPYEQWVKNNKPDNLNNNLLVKFANLDTAFDELAKYSNEYFLSKDTVDINENQFTEKIINKKIYLISKDNEGNNYKLIEKKIVVGKVFYNFDIQVHADYHSLLAPKAISYSAGVIDLFFEQTEAYNSQRITHNSQPETQNTQLTTQNTQQQNTEIQKHENTKTQKQEEEQEEAKTEETNRGLASGILEAKPLFVFVSVSRIIDGDTIEISTGEKVRYIGIDTPELNKPGPDDDECLAWEARIRNMELLSKGKVYLVKDPGVDKDKYGRLLRYVYAVETKSPKDVKAGSPALTSFGDLVSTTFINAQLVQEGFAKTFFCKPGWTDCPVMLDSQRKSIILSAGKLAEDNGYGIFGVCEDQMSEVRNRISDIGNQKTKDNNKITDDRQQTTNNNLQTDKEIKKEKETDNQKSRIDNPKKPFPFWLFTGNGDTTAPIITITSSPPAISSSTTANFQFSSNENNVIFLLRQGYRGQVGEGDDSWQECSANIEINNLNNNQHSLEIKAIDQSGNKSVAITHSWLVDTIAPTSTINNLEQEYATSSFLVSWTGEDVIASSTASSTEISGLANYDLEYKIATGTEEWINWISATTSTSAAFNITVENNQNIYFKIRARDNAGNVGEWS